MSIARKFLGLSRPALELAAEYLLARYAQGQAADFSGVVVVVPVGRAGRRLLEILVTQCQERDLVLTPPTIETIGALPEQLYEIKKPLASDLTQQLAWARALAMTDVALLRQIVPQPPAADRWLELGTLIQRQHRELASDRLNFATVLEHARALPGFDEEPRWQALADVQNRYLRLLDNLEIWDKQTARLFAIDHRECHTELDFVLIGVVDLNRAMRAMLDQIAGRATALVYTPQEWAERFDGYGCLIPAAWQETTLAIDDAQIERVDSPADQAYAVAQVLARKAGKYRVDEISIGLTDESLAPQIARQLAELNIATRFVKEKPLPETGPYLVLSALADYLETRSFAAFARLVRHPDVYDWLLAGGVNPEFLTQLDDLQCRRLPARCDSAEEWLAAKWPAVARAITLVTEQLAGPFAASAKPLTSWIEPIEQVLPLVYGRRVYDANDPSDRVTLGACEELHKALASLQDVPVELTPSVDAASGIRRVLSLVAESQIPPPAADGAIEMLGWLELPLDDAKSLILTNFNEGFLPSSLAADLFLPNRLRNHLGLNDSARLYARDAYSLSVLLASQEVTLIVGRRDREHNPLAPSRLLFAAEPQQIAARARKFFGPQQTPCEKQLLGGTFAPRAESQFEVPPPLPLAAPLTTLRVTDFRSYLECPYRFYLRRVLKLSCLNDTTDELDGGRFGDLLHGVLQAFGEDAAATCIERPKDLADWLANCLYTRADALLGANRLPIVNVQIEQLRLRLNAFAQWQTRRTREGWRIYRVEGEFCRELRLAGESALVQGRIDRIDHHPDLRQWLVLDYKSGDSGASPKDTHLRKKNEWIDLQLPLYRHLAQDIEELDGAMQVGYILLPRDVRRVGESLAEWGEDELASADAVAAEVMAGIRGQQFWPPSEKLRWTTDELAAICQANILGRRLGTWPVEAGS